MKVSIVQSTVQIVFGVLDQEGDVIQKQPFSLEIAKLNEHSLKEALAKICEAKESLVKQLQKPMEVMSEANATGNSEARATGTSKERKSETGE